MWQVVSGESVSLHDPPSHIHQLQLAYKIKIIENVHRWAKKKKLYVHNIFTTNPKWQVVTSCYCWGKKVILVSGSNLNQ